MFLKEVYYAPQYSNNSNIVEYYKKVFYFNIFSM